MSSSDSSLSPQFASSSINLEFNSKFLKGPQFMELLSLDKFETVESVDHVDLMKFKREGYLLLKLPSSLNERNPFDGYCWSKTKTNKATKGTEERHQPTYSNIVVRDQKVQSINCTEYSFNHIHKQVVHLDDHTFVYYFKSSDDDVILPDIIPAKKRIDKRTMDTLKTSVLPYRNLDNALKIAKDMGLHVTRKQLQNVSRTAENCIIGRTGPKSRTTKQMAEGIEKMYPDQVWYTYDVSEMLTEFCFIHVFDEACRMFLSSCPDDQKWTEWIDIVDILQKSDEAPRKKTIAELLEKCPNGVFFPSRLHVDTTFNLLDMFVTVLLGETASFLSNQSKKARVIPIGFMVHSSKKTENHVKFAEKVLETFRNIDVPPSSKQIPCILLDGETSLESYASVLGAAPIRCDVHILSLLRYQYGGKNAVATARPLLFGRMENGKWKTGLFGSFSLHEYQRRLEKLKGVIDEKIFDWLKTNENMLMNSASALAKLRGGHLMQFSTNNPNENFNALLIAKLSKRYTAVVLIRKMMYFCDEKLTECWLSASGASDKVQLAESTDKLDFSEKMDYFERIGLNGCRIHALNAPSHVLKRIDWKSMIFEDRKVNDLEILTEVDGLHQLIDKSVSNTDRSRRLVSVEYADELFDCWNCGVTLPDFICCHVLLLVGKLSSTRRASYWKNVMKMTSNTQKNGFSKRSGAKLSDRIGVKSSAHNRIRTMKDVTNLTIFSSPVASSPAASDSSITSSPVKAADRALDPFSLTLGLSTSDMSHVGYPTSSTPIATVKASTSESAPPRSDKSRRSSGRVRKATRMFSPLFRPPPPSPLGESPIL